MMPDTSFLGLMQAHVGGLVRVAELNSGLVASAFNGKFGLLLRANSWNGGMGAVAELFIDGRCVVMTFLPGEIEIIARDP
jgi:hypothetical protein